MTTKTIDLHDAPPYFDEFGRLLRAAAIRGLVSAAALMVNEIKLRIIPQRTPVPIDRRIYSNGWRSGPLADGAFVENTEPHAAFIEYGVKNVKIGPRTILALAEWIHRKAGVEEGPEAIEAAWRIARLIRARGIFNGGQGLGVLKQANERARDFIKQEVAKEVARM